MIKLEDLLKPMGQSVSRAADFFKKYYFYCFIGLLLLAFLAAGLVYYFYVLTAALPTREEPVKVNLELYNKTRQIQIDRQASLQQEIEKNYPDIFR